MAAAISRVTDLAEAQAQFDVVANLARRQIGLTPWDEVAHRRLMTALAMQGQRAEALAQYDRCVVILNDELGVDPDQATIDLAAQIHAGELTPAPRRPTLFTDGKTGATLDPYAVISRLEPLPDQKLFGIEDALSTVEKAVDAKERS